MGNTTLSDLLRNTRPQGLGRICTDALDIRDALFLELSETHEVRVTIWDDNTDSPTFPIYITPKVQGNLDDRLIVGADFDGIWGGIVRGRRIVRATFKQVRPYSCAPENWTIRGVTDEIKGRGWKDRMVEVALQMVQEGL